MSASTVSPAQSSVSSAPTAPGKTTLFNLLNGFVRPDQGAVVLERTRPHRLKPNRICRLGVGRTFQVVRTFARMSALQNVTVGALVATRSDIEAVETARNALRASVLTERAACCCRDLEQSGAAPDGARARASRQRPKLLLLDETLAGLGRQEVEEMIARDPLAGLQTA